MAKRYIGDAIVTVEYAGESPDGRSQYRGTIRAGGHTWPFSDLGSPVGGFPTGGTSPEAYDKMAASAVSFASYYTTDNRGDDVPAWAPPPEVADAIAKATEWATDEEGRGQYQVRRSPKGKPTLAERQVAAKRPARPKLDPFTRAYVEAALWSSTDESDEQGGDPLDKNYGIEDIDPKTMAAMVRDCADFQKRFDHLIEDDDSPAIRRWGRWELAGHEFWLTRNGHGAGFGDGNFPKHDDELSDIAETYGYFELYVGDDGVIYAYAVGEEPPREVREPSRSLRSSHARSGGQRAVRARAGNSVRDYVAVDHRGRPVAGPFTDYGAAKRAADRAAGFVKYAPPGRAARESRRPAHRPRVTRRRRP
jgi:hypothetical protein